MKKLILFGIISILVVFAFWQDLNFSGTENSQEESQEKNIFSESDVLPPAGTTKNEQKIPTHHADTPKSAEVVSASAGENEIPGMTNPDESKDEEIYQRTASQLRKMLEQKNHLNPDSEFQKAKNFDLTEVQGGMFSGVFTDALHNFNLALIADEEAQISPSTCLELAPGKFFRPPQLKVKMTEDGFALLMIENQFYARLAVELTTHRLLLGKLYQKKESKWLFVSDIEAPELKSRKIPDACKFR